MSARANSGGTSGRTRFSGTGLFCRTAATSSVIDSPVNGVVPATSSNSETPSDQMSARTSTCLEEVICSGDM